MLKPWLSFLLAGGTFNALVALDVTYAVEDRDRGLVALVFRCCCTAEYFAKDGRGDHRGRKG